MIDCSSCRLASFCFAPTKNACEYTSLDNLIDKRLLYHRNEHIYRKHDPLKKIIILRSGSVKIYTQNAREENTILGFCYPGEILGFNAIASGRYQEHAIALDTVSTCELDYNQFEKMTKTFPAFQKQFIQLMSEQMSSAAFLSLSSSAESRIAFFLLSISKKMKNYGASGMSFNLRMTRSDIANYLGLASETVSRILAKFQLNNILNCSNKNVTLHDYHQLQTIASQRL